jgi:hypothetical protein
MIMLIDADVAALARPPRLSSRRYFRICRIVRLAAAISFSFHWLSSGRQKTDGARRLLRLLSCSFIALIFAWLAASG